jgi:hypothetical protein
MSDIEDQKFGLAGNEQAQGYESMPVAHPAPSTDDLPTAAADSSNWLQTEDERRHHLRPAPPEPEVREYRNVQTGESIPENQTVSAEQAAHDVGLARESERAAREQREQADLKFALDQLPQDGQPPQQPTHDQQPTPLDELQPETAEAEAARAEVDGAWAKADAEITEFLKNPHIRERIQGEYDQIKQTAAAEAKQEVERAYNLSAAVQQHYATATNNLVAEAGGIIGALYPELNGLSGERLQGALAIMQQTNPQRVQALQQLASRAQGLVQAQQRQQYEAQQGHAMQQQHELEKFSAAEEKRYVEAVKHESAETMRAVRENVYPTVEKAYGIPKETMQRLYSGEQRVDSAAFVRSAAFQLMLTDAVKYRLAQRGITQARTAVVPKVQRPGVAAEGPRVYDGDLSAAASRFNLPGGNEGTQGLKNAAAWITARRGGR